mmetsp:Transcript_25/g.89  ORF Transcript_25/g.89 Transcript_25/m.89 type:complete len:210 (-) Transcript_25:286-915(-)
MRRTCAMRVEPPTRTTSSTSSIRMPTRSSTCLTGASARSKRGAESAWYSKREKRSGPAAARLGGSCTATPVSSARAPSSKAPPQSHSSFSSILTRSASSRRARIASTSASTSTDGSAARTRPTRASRSPRLKSCPPSLLSPAAAITSKMPLFRLSRDTSSVPPPMSYTITVLTRELVCRPYAIAAAVGSWMQRSTLKPASTAASLVALI